MKLIELTKEFNSGRKIRFSNDTDKRFFSKYQFIDCVICYAKQDFFPYLLWIILKGEDKFYAIKLNTYNKMFIYQLNDTYKEIEKMGIKVANDKELGEVKKHLIVEALERDKLKWRM